MKKIRKPIINIWPYSEVKARLAIILKRRGLIDGNRIDKKKKQEIKLYIRRLFVMHVFDELLLSQSSLAT